jgi:NitT/TauT family transport system permease protein
MSWLRRSWPVVAVMLATVALGYPVALLFGLPLARQRMHDLSNWVTATVSAAPVAVVPNGSNGSLTFDHAPAHGVLVRNGAPVAARYRMSGSTVSLETPLARPAVRLGAALEGPLDPSGLLYRLPPGADAQTPLYVGGKLLRAGADAAIERADGRATTFTFHAASGPVAVGDRVLVAGRDYRAKGDTVTFTQPPDFNVDVRRITGAYAVLDPAKGIIALAHPSAAPPRVGQDEVRLAERLTGAVDGRNRTFAFAHAPVVETDSARQVYVDGRPLSSTPQRPKERVDGKRTRFTFTSTSGLVTVDGTLMTPGSQYTRDGPVVTFSAPPRRNAEVRQYRDYLVSNVHKGTILLAAAPKPGSVVWAAHYSYYARPECGTTVMQCFYSMPQHPVPFPNWIAAQVIPYFTQYPITDPRNIVRGVLYTTAGTVSALLLGAAFGVLLAVLFVFLRPLEQALLPWVIASQTVPIIALVPVLLLILGNFGITVQTSLIPTALIGAYIAFFPVTVGTVTGLRSVDPLALDLMKSYAANPFQVFVKVRFPAAVPFLFTSLKLGTAAALVGALVAETESNNRSGLGYDIIGQVQAGNVSDLWILLLISAALGIGLVALIGLVQRFSAPWDRP